jgi:dUTP pyrophosphatase
MHVKVEIKLLDPRLKDWGFPNWGSPLAAGVDLHACVDQPLRLEPDGFPELISSGLAIRIGDPNWCALIVPRSGLGHKGLVLGNTIGVIDADYEGPCLISAWNRNPPSGGDDTAITIHPGDRIAQLVLTRIVRPEFQVVSEFDHPSTRGQGGFGSTGIK